ncbi:hypothetical protein ACFSR7_10205 [Cohnella sp. GCM10020058]|uniref:hypothetical protein n=1 Tax=Cohnella sp. GCM10020058 TaxID=3317330 RepID=UPI00363A90DE
MKAQYWMYGLVILFACLFVNGTAHADNKTYYVDAAAGSDGNTGLSQTAAWKSLIKVNATTFGPGDKILLKAGGTWTGTLQPQGSGAAGSRIVLDRYGTGADPRIDGQGANAVVRLYNQEYWSIGHLEITNQTATQGTTARSGVLVIGEDYQAGTVSDIVNVAVLHDIHLHDLYIHDVNGLHTKTVYGSAGINVVVRARSDGSPNRVTKFDQVLIENNKIERVTRTGIMVNSEWYDRDQQGGVRNANRPWTPATGVVIRGNEVLHVSGDGIVPHVSTGALVEHNRVDGYNEAQVDYNAGMWTYNGDYTVYQYNEVSGGKTIKDGMSFDFDNGTKGLVFQYNYSHDNEGGTVLICQNETGGSVTDGVFRYNISQNDKYQMITVCSGANYGNMQFYNNVFYVGSGLANNLLVNQGGNGAASFKNNIFYNLGTGGYTKKSTWTYDSNVFYGNNVPSSTVIPDAGMLTSNPLFVNPGSGTGIDGLGGYKLQAASPAIDRGVAVASNGGKDFWGNALYVQKPDRGAFEHPAVVNAAAGKTPTSGSFVNNAAYATDGATGDKNLYAGLDQGLQYLQLDLGASYAVNRVKLWRFYDNRIYKDIIVQMSTTADFSSGVTTVFNNDANNSAGKGAGTDAEYAETAAGKEIVFNSVTARYVRIWSNGSSVNAWNHYVETQVFGILL